MDDIRRECSLMRVSQNSHSIKKKKNLVCHITFFFNINCIIKPIFILFQGKSMAPIIFGIIFFRGNRRYYHCVILIYDLNQV